MPGRTPAEAFDHFCDPLRRALACVGAHAKITPSPGGRSAPNVTHAWSLNGTRGLVLGDYLLSAQMHYEFIPCDEGWRVTTKAYRYKLSRISREAASLGCLNPPHLGSPSLTVPVCAGREGGGRGWLSSPRPD